MERVEDNKEDARSEYENEKWLCGGVEDDTGEDFER